MRITTTQTKPQLTVAKNGDVVLNRLIETKEDVDALTASITTLYIYDQVKFNVPYTRTLVKDIHANFDRWFKYGELENKAAIERQTRQAQTRVLVKEGEQPKINEAFEQKADTSFGALVEIHMLILDLQAQIEALKGKTT